MKYVLFFLFAVIGFCLHGTVLKPVEGKEPVFTADGQGIVFRLDDDEGNSNLRHLDLKTGKVTVLKLEGKAPFRVSDGRIFYFGSGLFPELYELDLKSHSSRKIDLPRPFSGMPFEAERGILIYPSGLTSPPQLFRWKIGDLQVREEKTLPEETLQISPNGNYIVLRTTVGSVPNFKLLEKKSGKVLFQSRKKDGLGCFSPVFSPDSRYLCFVEAGIQPVADLRLLEIKTGKIIRLTTDSADNQSPAFSPDGRFIVFTTWRDNKHLIKILSVPE